MDGLLKIRLGPLFWCGPVRQGRVLWRAEEVWGLLASLHTEGPCDP